MQMKLLNCMAFILLAGFVPAEGAPTYTASKIVFNHPGLYSQVQLEAAAGMHSGSSFNADDLGAAAQRLVDTGFFENVGATLEGKANAASVLFDIKTIDRAQMLHVGFENFIWLSHSEIEDALRAKSPLFLDYLPDNSPLQDVFTAALTDALAAKGIAAKVAHDMVEPTMVRPERTIEFRTATPSIRVAKVKLGGVAVEFHVSDPYGGRGDPEFD